MNRLVGLIFNLVTNPGYVKSGNRAIRPPGMSVASDMQFQHIPIRHHVALEQLLAVELPAVTDPNELEVIDHAVADQEGHGVEMADCEGAAAVQVLAWGPSSLRA